MNTNQILKYNIFSSNLDIDSITRQLASYGINNFQIERGPNINSISIFLQNPTPYQLQGINNVLTPIEQNFETAIYQKFRLLNEGEMYNPPQSYNLPTVKENYDFTMPQTQGIIPFQNSPLSLEARRYNNVTSKIPVMGRVIAPSNIRFEIPPL
jgi:hypothetical protein